MSNPQQIAEILLKVGAVALNPTDPFTYASGIRSPIYCDNRLLITYPGEREKVVEGFLNLLQSQNWDAEVIAGTSTAGIAWAAWIAEKLKKPMIYIRGAAKAHGKGNQIEGRLQKGQSVVVIEDLISTGGSSLSAVKAVQEAGGQVLGCAAIFTYQMKKALQSFADAQVPSVALSDFSSLITVAEDQNLIVSEQKDLILSWNQDPSGWAEKNGL